MSNSRADDPRMGTLLEAAKNGKNDSKTGYKVGLIGYPIDEGVVRNGGRPGAREGPDALRPLLTKMGTVYNREFNVDISQLHFEDLGNIPSAESLEEHHKNLETTVLKALSEGFLPICIGGGNDQSYPNGAALLRHMKNTQQKERKLAVINIDAHLDVRPAVPKPHSGSPFRQIIEMQKESETSIKLIEFAAQGSQCSRTHADWVIENGGEIHWLSQVKAKGVLQAFRDILDSLVDHTIFFSFDIDSIVSSDCPGVSCPASIGLTSQEAIDLCTEAGQQKNVVLMDISEYSPPIEMYRTGKLVGNLIYYFLMGIASRK